MSEGASAEVSQGAGGVQYAQLLVVSPNAAAGAALQARLARAGYGVERVASAAAGVASMPPDLALLALSAADGLNVAAAREAARLLKSVSDGTYLPILVLTETEAEAEQDWAAGGADDALAQGASEARLQTRLATLLHLKRRHRAMHDTLAETEATCTAAAQEAARYEAAFQQSRDAVLLVNSDGCIVEACESACILTGYAMDKLTRQALSCLCPPELAWAGEISNPSALPFADEDTSLLTASGETVPVAVRAAMLDGSRDMPGQETPPLLAVVLTDNRPEQARRREAQRAAAAETAAALMREMNNPLFVISSNVELLQSNVGAQDSGVQAKLGRIADAARRLAGASARIAEPPAPVLPRE